jgi:hypothetical protein
MMDLHEDEGPTLVVNLYPDRSADDDPGSWRSEDLGSPSVLFRRAGPSWVALLEKQAVLRAATPEALAADVYGEYGVLAVLHPQPLAGETGTGA